MKKFTIENLKADDFSIDDTTLTLLKEVGVDIPNALKAHKITELQCAIIKGYDCQSAWIDGVFTWDDRGAITSIVGHGYTAMSGNQGTSTAGREGIAIANYEGTATAGDWGTAIAGCRGIATAGREGTATAGDWGIATAGDEGTATAGCGGTATAGDGGTATTGREGTATAGRGGTATAGYEGAAMAGEGGIIQIKYYDFRTFRLRIKTGYIGEDGLLPNTPYKLDDNNNFVKASV